MAARATPISKRRILDDSTMTRWRVLGVGYPGYREGKTSFLGLFKQALEKRGRRLGSVLPSFHSRDTESSPKTDYSYCLPSWPRGSRNTRLLFSVKMARLRIAGTLCTHSWEKSDIAWRLGRLAENWQVCHEIKSQVRRHTERC